MQRLVEQLAIGDKILPPARELSLWMKREARERGIPETAIWMTVLESHEGNPDNRGRWWIVKGRMSDEWTGDTGRPFQFSFKARPDTFWSVVP